MPLFDSVAENVVLSALRKSRENDREILRDNFQMAIDYLNNNQLKHVKKELLDRYQNTQQGDAGQEIFPVTMPITERYIAEAASAYNKPVERGVIDKETGEEHEDYTSELANYLSDIGYDEKMHRNEQLCELLKTNCIWYQEKRGVLRPVITYAHDVYPIVNPTDPQADPSDPDDYLGFVVEIAWGDEDPGLSQQIYALLTPDQMKFYTARSPYSVPDKTILDTPNQFTWPQRNERGDLVEMPLQMLTFWHRQQYEGELIVKVDPTIAYANHELNIQWSLLFDTMRTQGWAVPVFELINPEHAASRQKWGARFPVNIRAGESFSLQTGSAPYSEIVQSLQAYSKLLAISLRQSPNDYSLQQSAATSGFAKVVDSLPKIEARREKLKRLKRLEEQVAWPRIASILRKQKIFGADIVNYKLSVKFSDIEIPKSEDEKRTELETNFKYGLANPIDVIMERYGIGRDEAEEIYEENKRLNGGGNGGNQMMPSKEGAPAGALARLVAQRRSMKENKQEEKEQAKDEGPPTR